jgi:hypothetical protein
MVTKNYVDNQVEGGFQYSENVLLVMGSTKGRFVHARYFASEKRYEEMLQTKEFEVACNLLENEYDWFYLVFSKSGRIVSRSGKLSRAIDFMKEHP